MIIQNSILKFSIAGYGNYKFNVKSDVIHWMI